MSGRISGLGMGSTRDRLAALDARISQDWQAMGFMPPQTVADPRAQYVGNNTDIFVGANSPLANTGPDPFGQDTRAGLAAQGAEIDADMARTNALVDAILNAPAGPPQPRNAPSGMAYTPELPKPQPAAAMAPPKPKARPRPETYTIKAGDNPTTIAKAFGMSLKELEAKNPGILRKARRLKVGATVKV
jgi:predicted component of type VI protein secretion system